MNNVISGAIAGTAASLPMSAVLTTMHNLGPLSESNPVPPELITRSVLNRFPRGRKLDDDTKYELAIAAHFAYGATTGALFSLIAPKKPTVLAGAAYGFAVWAASYFGWVPAFDVLPPATRFSKYRNTMMIGAHLVWGASLAATYARLNDRTVSTQP